jgi:hypothetical protein
MHTGCTRDFPVYLRCASGVPPVYTLWEPLRPGGFAEGFLRAPDYDLGRRVSTLSWSRISLAHGYGGGGIRKP